MLITIGKSLQTEMIDDFSLEYKQQKKLHQQAPLSPHGLRAIERMRVIESSIGELKEQMKDPQRHDKFIHGGYSNEELARMNNLPRNLNGV